MKKLTEMQRDILALAIVQPGYRLDTPTMQYFGHVAMLTIGGYLEADTGCSFPLMVATNKGVRTAVRLGIVEQRGTKFHLPDGSKLEMQAPPTPAPVASFANVHAFPPPPKPRDPFDEGFTAGRNGQPTNNTWTDAADASMYDEGFKQGDLWRQQHPVASA